MAMSTSVLFGAIADAIIPAVGGIVLLAKPQLLAGKTAAGPEHDRKVKLGKTLGGILLVVAILYFLSDLVRFG